MEGQAQAPKLLDQVRNVLRLHHYSIHTERSYIDWIKRYVHFHEMRRREDLGDGERKIEAFLTNLAVRGKVSASTQNQAMNALVFLYKKVLGQPLDQEIDAVRAERKLHVPVVLAREEVSRVIALLDGVPQLIVKLLYGSGLRILEAVRLRIKDVDFAMKQVTVRSGKGEKDRFTTLSATLIPLLQNHLQRVKTFHEQDLAQGHGAVYLPYALERKYPGAARDWSWQYLFPARDLSPRPAHRGDTPPSRGPGCGEQGHQGGGPPGGIDQGDQRPHLPAQLCRPPATTGHGHPHDPGTAGPFGCRHHDDLHPCAATGRPRRTQPPGRPPLKPGR